MEYFRTMMAEADGLPSVARTARALGVRVPEDVRPDEGGHVHPGTGGMSVSPSSVWNLPNHRRPKPMGRGSTGPVADRVFVIEGAWVDAQPLVTRPDPARAEKHAFVEPRETMPLHRFETALAETRPHWRQVWP